MKKMTAHSRAVPLIDKWNFWSPEYCHKLFSMLRDCIGLLCANSKNNVNKEFWAEILAKLVKQNVHFKSSGLLFFIGKD